MPHAAIYQRPIHAPINAFTVTVSSPEGREQFVIQSDSREAARREAIRLYAAERDTPVQAWARVH